MGQNKMLSGKLTKRVDLNKLTETDFVLSGQFRVVDENYHGWRLGPEFRQKGNDAYVNFDQLFPDNRFHECYELIVQTPDCSEVVGSGYLHKSRREDVSFGVRSGIEEGRLHINSFPVWFNLLNDADEPIVDGPADFVFVKVSPWHSERDNQRQRVLCD